VACHLLHHHMPWYSTTHNENFQNKSFDNDTNMQSNAPINIKPYYPLPRLWWGISRDFTFWKFKFHSRGVWWVVKSPLTVLWEKDYSPRRWTARIFEWWNAPGKFLRSNWIKSPTIPPCSTRRGVVGLILIHAK